MSDEPSPPWEFRQSFALIDSDGKLIDWDSGFELEFADARDLIRPGASYADILHRFAEGPVVQEVVQATFGFVDLQQHLEDRTTGVATERTQDYKTKEGWTIRIEERSTRNGGFQRIARDITEEIQAKELAQNRFVEVGGIPTELWREPNGAHIFPRVNEEMCRLLNLPPDLVGADAMAVHSRLIVTPEENARTAALFEESARSLTAFRYDFCIRDREGRRRWFRESLTPNLGADGTIHYSGFIRDVTRERQAEDELELMRNVVVRSADSILLLETDATPAHDTRVIYLNPQYTELYGGTLEELFGRDTTALFADDTSRASSRQVVAALRRGDGLPIEFRAHNRHGQPVWVEARVYTVQKLDDESYRWAIVSRDVSDRRRAQAELLEAKEAAEAASRAKGEFLANMSHELRTPLNAIIGFSELIEQGVTREGWHESYSEYLHDISASGRHLLSLINTILDLSKIEAGMVTLDLGVADVDELLVASVALVGGLATAGSVDIRLTRPSEPLEINGDYIKLKQVLLNVLSNAIKFTPPGGVVQISTSVSADAIGVTVSDTGCGISTRDLARIAQPFVQVESTLSRRHAGTGLGLSIAKRLCELHGGDLTISSTEGKGTTVDIVLPRLVGRIAAAVQAVQERRALPH